MMEQERVWSMPTGKQSQGGTILDLGIRRMKEGLLLASLPCLGQFCVSSTSLLSFTEVHHLR